MTTEATEAMSAVHDRMPVILTSTDEAVAWLEENDRTTLEALVRPASEQALTFTPVSDCVNKSSNECERCVAPV